MGLFDSITDALGLTHHEQDGIIADQQNYNNNVRSQELSANAPAANVGGQALGDLSTVFGLDGGAGGGAGGNLAARTASFMDRFKSSPIYQMIYGNNIDASQKAIQRNATANGMSDSGATFKALGDNAGVQAGNSLLTYIQGLQGLDNQGTAATNAQNATRDAQVADYGGTTDAKLAAAQSTQGALGKLITGGVSALASGGTSLFTGGGAGLTGAAQTLAERTGLATSLY